MPQARRVLPHRRRAGSGQDPLDVNDMNIDLLSISGHKLYGPKGVGALYVRRKPRVRLHPIISGGGQERGLRSGTVPAPLAVGLGKAAEVALEEMERDNVWIKHLFHRLYDGIRARVPRSTSTATSNGAFTATSTFPLPTSKANRSSWP